MPKLCRPLQTGKASCHGYSAKSPDLSGTKVACLVVQLQENYCNVKNQQRLRTATRANKSSPFVPSLGNRSRGRSKSKYLQ